MRKKQILTVFLVVMAFVMALPMMGNVQASPQTIIEICPETTLVEIGEYFTVDINISDTVDIIALQLVLRYDPNILNVIDVVGFPEMNFRIDEEFAGVPTVHAGYDCDVVPDGVLDVHDLAVIDCAYSSTPGDPNWNPRADVNNDGCVNVVDFMICVAALNETAVDSLGTIQFISFPDAWEGGTFATVTFEAIGPGETLLDLDNTKLTLICGEPIPHEVRDGTAIVSPEGAIQSLITTIESWNLPQGAENSLILKLEAANDLLNKDKVNGAIHKLLDFINYVEALRERKLTDEQADYLVAMAQAIINLLV